MSRQTIINVAAWTVGTKESLASSNCKNQKSECNSLYIVVSSQ